LNGSSVSVRARGSSELSELFSESLELGGDASEITGDALNGGDAF
jgi:hypothetical protein